MAKLAVLAVVLLCMVFCVFSKSAQDQFAEWIIKHGKTYQDATEFKQRFANFQQTLQRIERHSHQNNHATFALNKFSDLSEEEFARTRKMQKTPADQLAVSCLANGATATLNFDTASLPSSFDWRTQGAVTGIKDQGQCGSCWTFSASGNIEGQWFLKTKELVSFSEQILVDCSHACCNVPGYGDVCNSGCEGGWQWTAFYDVVNWGGIQTEESYPYTSAGGSSGQCHRNVSALMAKITNYTCLSAEGNPANEDQMAAYLTKNGPVSVALDAGYLQDYSSGIIDPWVPIMECDPNALDHALLVVGFGEEENWMGENVPFWIVKNSWGEDWGENGYFRIFRGENVCGIANAVSSAFF